MKVSDFRRCGIDDALQEARIHELFHRLAAGPGSVEHQAIETVLERVSDRLDARRRNAEHRQANGRHILLFVAFVRRLGNHPGERVGSVCQNPPRDAV